MDGIKLLPNSPQLNNSSFNPSIDQSGDFHEHLKDAIKKVNDLQIQADQSIQNLVTGRTDNIADVMMAVEKADIALRMMMQIRNKMIEAYQEVMKMQV